MTSDKILIVDDAPANIRLLAGVLEPRGSEILTASNGDQALRIAAKAHPDVILLDVVMPGTDGFAVCRRLKDAEATRAIPVLFVTAKDDTESLLHGFRCGAVDYISKPFQADEALARVETHLRISRAAAERRVTSTAQAPPSVGMSGLVGRSRPLRRLHAEIERLQQFAGTSVLVTGESGTGKELVARAIHGSSPRASGPFIPVNCVAIPGELAESMFFGHRRGAFTGAVTDRKGWFELADGGTLFLDEIGDMPPALQAKLLRVLEDGQVMPVGASHPRHVDVRVVAATNADLQERIVSGAFRADLYFRLARYVIEMPPLRDRVEDVGPLADHFLSLFATEIGVPPPLLTPGARALLESHTFPGNVRELKNAVERALIESAGEPIEPSHVRLLGQAAASQASQQARSPVPHQASRQAPAAARVALPSSPSLNLEAAEQALIDRALEETAGNVKEAARLLGVNRSRIYRKFPLHS